MAIHVRTFNFSVRARSNSRRTSLAEGMAFVKSYAILVIDSRRVAFRLPILDIRPSSWDNKDLRACDRIHASELGPVAIKIQGFLKTYKRKALVASSVVLHRLQSNSHLNIRGFLSHDPAHHAPSNPSERLHTLSDSGQTNPNRISRCKLTHMHQPLEGYISKLTARLSAVIAIR